MARDIFFQIYPFSLIFLLLSLSLLIEVRLWTTKGKFLFQTKWPTDELSSWPNQSNISREAFPGTESEAVVSQIFLADLLWHSCKISNPASSPLPPLVSLHSPSCENREPHLGNTFWFGVGRSPHPIHFTTAQNLLLALDREWDEQLRAEREQDSFPGTRASLSTETRRRRWGGAGWTLNLLHPFSTVTAEGLFL